MCNKISTPQLAAYVTNTAQKMKFSIKDIFNKCDQNRRDLRTWSHLLKRSLMENFIFCVVKDALDKYISCSEYHIQIHYRCTFLPSCKLYYFVEKKSKYICVNRTPIGLVDLSSDGVDVLINDIKKHLAQFKSKQ